MEYKKSIIAELTQLENYARTCFVQQMKEPNGQGEFINQAIDLFMSHLTRGEMNNRNLQQILLDDCLYTLLPECRNAERAQDTYLWTLVQIWLSENLGQCDECYDWYFLSEGQHNKCPACLEHENNNDPDTVADFFNDLDRCDD